MELKYNVSGSERKRMVVAIEKLFKSTLSTKERRPTRLRWRLYCRPIRHFDWPDVPETERLVQALATEGFVACQHEALTIEMPRSDYTDTALHNLKQLVESKSSLIRHALG